MTPLVVDSTPTSVPVALVPTLDADGDHIPTAEFAWARLGNPGELENALVDPLFGFLDCSV